MLSETVFLSLLYSSIHLSIHSSTPTHTLSDVVVYLALQVQTAHTDICTASVPPVLSDSL